MGRGISATSQGRSKATMSLYPTLIGNPTWEEMEEFTEKNTAYRLSPNTEGKVDPEVLKSLLNKTAQMNAKYGDPTEGNKPYIIFNGRLRSSVAQVYEDDTIALSSHFKKASSILGLTKQETEEWDTKHGKKPWWNVSENMSRESLISYPIAHELAHTYFYKGLRDRYGTYSGAAADIAWDNIISAAKTKYGLSDGSRANSAYPYVDYGLNSKRFSHEAFADAVAGYECGQRDPISMAAHDWMIGAVL